MSTISAEPYEVSFQRSGGLRDWRALPAPDSTAARAGSANLRLHG